MYVRTVQCSSHPSIVVYKRLNQLPDIEIRLGTPVYFCVCSTKSSSICHLSNCNRFNKVFEPCVYLPMLLWRCNISCPHMDSYDRTFATYMRRLKRLLGCSLVPRSVLIYRSDRFLTIIFRDRLTNSEWCLCG